MEALGAALQACLPKTQGDMLLAAILGMLATTQLEALLGRGPAPLASIPIALKMLTPQGGHKMLVPFI